jgi:hypothetical protein
MSRRRIDIQRNRELILSTILPPEIETNLRGRSRVAVRTVRDLEIYVTFIDDLCRRHQHFYGHKKVRYK